MFKALGLVGVGQKVDCVGIDVDGGFMEQVWRVPRIFDHDRIIEWAETGEEHAMSMWQWQEVQTLLSWEAVIGIWAQTIETCFVGGLGDVGIGIVVDECAAVLAWEESTRCGTGWFAIDAWEFASAVPAWFHDAWALLLRCGQQSLLGPWSWALARWSATAWGGEVRSKLRIGKVCIERYENHSKIDHFYWEYDVGDWSGSGGIG